MLMDSIGLHKQLEELNLLKCSLMPGETLSFVSTDTDDSPWPELLAAYSESGPSTSNIDSIASPARFQLRVDGSSAWLEVQLHKGYPSPVDRGSGVEPTLPEVLVRGDELSRGEHERWQAVVRDTLDKVRGSEYPLYELISTYLLPLLHEEAEAGEKTGDEAQPSQRSQPTAEPSATRYHALLTSHHLISPTKRRNLQQWSSQLQVTGFAKVGYPGVIYCEGVQEQVEQFVANIKAMQWLALRVRFIEPAPPTTVKQDGAKRRWTEFDKVGEVVEEMRRLGREKFVVEMGIGSAGTK